MRQVGMVIGKRAEGDHGTMLPRDLSRGQIESGWPHNQDCGSG